MLSAADTRFVKDYIYDSYPELDGRVAIRSFTPIIFKLSDDPGQDEKREYEVILASEGRAVAEDFLDQFSGNALDEAHALLKSLDPALRREFNTSATCRIPSILSLDAFAEEGKLSQNLYMVNQFPAHWKDKDIYRCFMAEDPVQALPENFGRAMRIIAMAHEFGHAVQGQRRGKDATRYHEGVCDVLAYACASSIMGYESVSPVFRMFAEFREKRDAIDPLHNTSGILKEIMDHGWMKKTDISARQAVEYGMLLQC